MNRIAHVFILVILNLRLIAILCTPSPHIIYNILYVQIIQNCESCMNKWEDNIPKKQYHSASSIVLIISCSICTKWLLNQIEIVVKTLVLLNHICLKNRILKCILHAINKDLISFSLIKMTAQIIMFDFNSN